MQIRSILWSFVIFGEVLMYGVFPVLVDLSTNENGVSFLSTSLNFCIEVLKFVICLMVLRFQSHRKSIPSLSLGIILPFSVPALLYCINNNISVLVQTQMDPATFMVLGNLKILVTAALYKLFFKEKLRSRRLFAMALLTCGGIFNSWTAFSSDATRSLSEIHITWVGLISLCCHCFISGFCGVFTEFILKKDNGLSVYLQNAILYSFGIVFSFLGWLLQARNQMLTTGNSQVFNLFYGYTVYTWALLFTQAPTGLIISLIMKYKNNMVRLFIIASAPLVTAGLSNILFGLQIHTEFVMSAMFILVSAVLYNHKNINQNSSTRKSEAC